MLSDETLRKQYDMYGKERAVPSSGFGMHTDAGSVLVDDY